MYQAQLGENDMDELQWNRIKRELEHMNRNLEKLENMNRNLEKISHRVDINNDYTKNLNSNIFDIAVSTKNFDRNIVEIAFGIRQICYGIGFIAAILFGFVILVWAKGGFRLF